MLAGMVGGESHDAFAHSLCYMKCGEEQIAVGVLLKVNGVGPYELAGHPVHFAHVVCAESVEAAISSRQRDTRSKAQRDDPADLCGYHTYSHGDLLVDVEMPAVEETCFGGFVDPFICDGPRQSTAAQVFDNLAFTFVVVLDHPMELLETPTGFRWCDLRR